MNKETEFLQMLNNIVSNTNKTVLNNDPILLLSNELLKLAHSSQKCSNAIRALGIALPRLKPTKWKIGSGKKFSLSNYLEALKCQKRHFAITSIENINIGTSR